MARKCQETNILVQMACLLFLLHNFIFQIIGRIIISGRRICIEYDDDDDDDDDAGDDDDLVIH